MDARKQVASAIKDYLARERISREQFAFRTKLGKSTVDKLLIGLFSSFAVGLDWSLAGLDTKKTVSEWRALGLRDAFGRPLPESDIEGSLLLPMGHKGPAFMVYDNFHTIMEWNHSISYALAVGHLAEAVADLVHRGEDPAQVALAEAQAAPGRPVSYAGVRPSGLVPASGRTSTVYSPSSGATTVRKQSCLASIVSSREASSP